MTAKKKNQIMRTPVSGQNGEKDTIYSPTWNKGKLYKNIWSNGFQDMGWWGDEGYWSLKGEKQMK